MHKHISIKTRAAAVAACTLAVAGGAIALGSGASAQTPPTRTIVLKELEKGAKFKHVRNTRHAPRQSNLTGDILVITYPLADASGKVVGKLHGVCVTTVGARRFPKATASCTAAISLPDGALYGQFLLHLSSAQSSGIVSGGTGAYAHARGTVVSKAVPGGSQDTITLIR
jgi:hypothetical protein